jgi:hypothetical protein
MRHYAQKIPSHLLQATLCSGLQLSKCYGTCVLFTTPLEKGVLSYLRN